MMLPCSQFLDANRRQHNHEEQTFLVGDYFAPQGAPPNETTAVPQRLPVSERVRRWESRGAQVFNIATSTGKSPTTPRADASS